MDGNTSTEDFETSNAKEFEPGKEMELKLGYHPQEDTIYKGLIVGQKLKVSTGRPSCGANGRSNRTWRDNFIGISQRINRRLGFVQTQGAPQ
ncbi:MAG TPA: hypothetical protein PLU64_13340 [Saprospiraceae bacterium]|nr:hypothetical protein [Saprospiraceae bacterium]